MKLNRPQIEEMNKSIKLSINYKEIRSELVDHLASSIENEKKQDFISSGCRKAAFNAQSWKVP
ncbi:hypothetical protein [Pararhodonellum marinum]|uniref:hypothetical protein n=1 Tax=Pararhodonellum marinum TaxID=2755358 RepID=UPI0018906231|nr:hypothetical protein [Pararhodonellum marinum]